MECEKCEDKGFTEQEHGLIRVFCDCEKGKALRVEIIGGKSLIGASYTGILFQLLGKQTDESGIDELWNMCKEASLEKMEFPYVVEMPCGNTMRFDDPSSILNLSSEDIPCQCGNSSHYIVKFVDNREVIDDSISGAGQPDTNTGSTDTSKPKRTRKSKASKKSRK